MLLPGKRILMVIAPQDFCERQLGVARTMFETEGASVTLASVRTGRVRSMQGSTATATQAFSWLDPRDYDALLLVGGVGAEVHLWSDPRLQTIVSAASTARKVIGALCSASVVLARAGLLAGRRAASCAFAEARDELRMARAHIEHARVIRAENVITGADEEATSDWAHEVIRALAVA